MIYNINFRSPWKLLGLNLHEAIFPTPFTTKFANFNNQLHRYYFCSGTCVFN